MTLTAISNTIARAILSTIERDGICNLQNIEEAVFRELAVAEARAKQEEKPAQAAPVTDDIRRCANELVQMMLADAAQKGPNYYSSRVAMAHHHLCEALRK